MSRSCDSLPALNALLQTPRRAGQRIALVPTMGNLHDGHFSLIALARQHADVVVASVFVNPTQFGPKEDFARYPRTLAADLAGLQAAGCDVLFAPSVETVYPHGFAAAGASLRAEVRVPGLSEILCGAFRPGHFTGVATVVSKLFNLVQPQVAIFGEKDFQQLAVIRRMVAELNFQIDIIGAPTSREAHGLARSSRNQYLNAAEWVAAGNIYAILLEMRNNILTGQGAAQAQDAAMAQLLAAGFVPDYALVRSAQDIEIYEESASEKVALIAARLGNTRLIDNLRFSC
jgi:pantoate--beta-alanine ligase